MKKGFTLIELLVVISIIALLSSIVIAALYSARQKAQVSRFTQEIAELQKALEIYRTNYGHYPYCYTSSQPCFVIFNQSDGMTESFSQVLNELVAKKILGSNFIINNDFGQYLNDMQIGYYDTSNYPSSATDDMGDLAKCGGDSIAKYNDYVFWIYANDINGNQLSFSSLPIESGSGIFPLGVKAYCLGN